MESSLDTGSFRFSVEKRFAANKELETSGGLKVVHIDIVNPKYLCYHVVTKRNLHLSMSNTTPGILGHLTFESTSAVVENRRLE